MELRSIWSFLESYGLLLLIVLAMFLGFGVTTIVNKVSDFLEKKIDAYDPDEIPLNLLFLYLLLGLVVTFVLGMGVFGIMEIF